MSDHVQRGTRFSGRRLKVSVALVATVVSVAALSACGSSSGGSSNGGSTSTSATGAPADSTTLAASLKSLYAGTNVAPPATGPKAVSGKTVWVISCGQVAAGCSQLSNASVAAGKALGWNVKLYDGNFDANDAYVTGIQQAIAAKADGIILESIDCDTVRQALVQAKAAGVKTVNDDGFDCAGSPQFTASLSPSDKYPTTQAFAEALGAAQADWVASATKGKAKVLQFSLAGNQLTTSKVTGFKARLPQVCSGCSIEQTVTYTNAQYASPASVQQLASSALIKSASANAVVTPDDAFNLLGVGPAITASGRASSISAIGGDGTAAGVALITSSRGLNADIASSASWFGWAGADCLNRLFASTKCVSEGIGLQLGDKSHPLPTKSGQGYVPTIDYIAAYKKLWGK